MKTNTYPVALLLLIATACTLPGTVRAEERQTGDSTVPAAERQKAESEPPATSNQEPGYLERAERENYPLQTCLITGAKLGSMGDPYEHSHEGRLIRFCCKACVDTFSKDADRYIAILDEAVVKAQRAEYPLDRCVVTGNKLGAMGEPVDLVVANRLVRLCCPACSKDVRKDPVTFLKRIDAAKSAKADTAE